MKTVQGLFAKFVCFLAVTGLLVLGIIGCDTNPLDPGTGNNMRPQVEFKLPEPPQFPPEAGDVRIGTLFYPDEQYRFLVPVQRVIPFEESIARVTLEQLVTSAALNSELEPFGLIPALPEQTDVIGIAINEGMARVDLSSAVLNYEPDHERMVLGSILCTLKQFSSINQVEVMVEGEKLEQFPGGTSGRVPLGPECWINLEIDESLKDYRNFTAVKLYFCYFTPQGWIFYVPVTRVLPPVEDENLAVIQELLNGPRSRSGLFSDIPPGTELLDWYLVDGLLTIDLSKEARSYQGGRRGAENMVNQIRYTLFLLEGVEKIQLLVEGAKIALPEGIDLTVPLEPPETINYF